MRCPKCESEATYVVQGIAVTVICYTCGEVSYVEAKDKCETKS